MQIKNTRRYDYLTSRMTKFKSQNETKTDNTTCQPGCRSTRQKDTVTLENSLAVSYNAKHTMIPRDLILVLHLLFPREVKAHTHTKTCMLMFVTAVFVIAKTPRQSTVRPVVHG